MKKLLIFLALFILSGQIIAQTQIVNAKRVNISEKLMSGAYDLIEISDSAGQFYYQNMYDPTTPLSGVNLRTLQAALDSLSVVNETDPIWASDSTDIYDRLDNLDTIAGDKKVTNGDTLLTLEEYRILSNGAMKNVYSITLPGASNVAGRIALAVEGIDYPTGWVLAADGLNLAVTHNLGRWVTDVKVFAKTTGTQRQQLRDTAAENGLTALSSNELKIYSLATISKDIVIYLTFE